MSHEDNEHIENILKQIQEQLQAQAQLQKQLQEQSQVLAQIQKQLEEQVQNYTDTNTISFGDIGNNQVKVSVDNNAIAVLVLIILGYAHGEIDSTVYKKYLDDFMKKIKV